MKKRSLIPFALAASLMSGSASAALNGPDNPGPFWDEPGPAAGCYTETIRHQSGPEDRTVCPTPQESLGWGMAAYNEMNWPVAYENFRLLHEAEPQNHQYWRLMMNSALYAGYSGVLNSAAEEAVQAGNRDGVVLLALATEAARRNRPADVQTILNSVQDETANPENYFVATTARQFDVLMAQNQQATMPTADMLRAAMGAGLMAMAAYARDIEETQPRQAETLRALQGWGKIMNISVRQNLAPRDLRLRTAAAGVYSELGQPMAALRALDRILPEDRAIETHRLFAETYNTLWGADAGAAYLQEQVRRDPGNVQLHCSWGDALVRANRPAEAAARYDELVTLLRAEQNEAAADRVATKREALRQGGNPQLIDCPVR